MPMLHKAYAFDWFRFEPELHALLIRALTEKKCVELERFIDQHFGDLTDPYEGEPLSANWRSALENRDVQEHGDFALTRFYNPADDFGIAEQWTTLSDRLPATAANALLGFTIGPPERPFDPGRYGSYFQTPTLVRQSLMVLKPLVVPELGRFVELMERCAAERRGLYVTF